MVASMACKEFPHMLVEQAPIDLLIHNELFQDLKNRQNDVIPLLCEFDVLKFYESTAKEPFMFLS